MSKRDVHAISARVNKLFARCLAAFMVFVQVVAAAATCPDFGSSARGTGHACAQRFDAHSGGGEILCASDFVPADQMPPGDPLVAEPDLGPVIAVAPALPQAPTARQATPRHDVAPCAPVPRFLLFGRLLR